MRKTTAETLIKTIALNHYVIRGTPPRNDYVNVVKDCIKYCKEHNIYLNEREQIPLVIK